MSRTRPAWPAEEHEPKLDEDREQDEEWDRDPGCRPVAGKDPGEADPDGGAAEHHHGEPHEVVALRRPGNGARDDDPGDTDRDVGRRQPAGPVGIEEHRVGHDAQQRDRSPRTAAPVP